MGLADGVLFVQIRYILNQLLREYSEGFEATHEYTDADIETAIRIHEGDTLPGFPSVDVFEYLIRPLLEKLREPIMDTLNEVSQRHLNGILSPHLTP